MDTLLRFETQLPEAQGGCVNQPGSREELLAMGFTFERRTRCPGPRCGATIEFYRRVPGPQVAFRVDARTGKLIQHANECPDAKQPKEKVVAVEPKKLSRKLAGDRGASQGSLWKSL